MFIRIQGWVFHKSWVDVVTKHGATLAAILSALILAGGLSAACKPSPAERPESGCVRYDEDKLHVFALPVSDQAIIGAAIATGPVMLGYDGCSFKVLQECKAPGFGRYQHTILADRSELVYINNRTELATKFPLWFVDFRASLDKYGTLTLAQTVKGVTQIPNVPTKQNIVGADVGRATHVITLLTYGEYTLFAGNQTAGSVSASGPGMGAGVKSSQNLATLNTGRCKQLSPYTAPECVVLRATIAPLRPY